MKFKLSRRTKLIGGIAVSIVLLFFGTFLALGKTGVINIGTLADTVVKTTKQVVTPKGPASSAGITLTLPEDIPAGATILIKNTTTGLIYNQAVTDPGNNIFTGNYTFNNIAPGHYEGDESKCVRVYPFNVSADEAGGHSTGEILASCSTSGGGIACGTQTCNTSQHCVGSEGVDGEPDNHFCRDNCTTNSCPSGQSCNATTKECAANRQLFGLRGTIRDGVSNSANYIGGATLTVLNKADQNHIVTLATGTSTSFSFSGGDFNYNYQTSTFTLPNNSYNNIYLNVTSPGKQPIELKLSDSGSIVGASSNDSTSFDQMKNIVMGVSTGKVDIQGSIKDDQNNLIANVTTTTGCTSVPTSAFEACKAKLNSPNYPYALSRSTTQITHANNQNYLISNVFDFSDETAFDEIKLYFQLSSSNSSYYFDANNDGVQGSDEPTGGRAIISVSKSDIRLDNASGQNSYVLKEVVFKKANINNTETYSIKGVVKDATTNANLAGVSVNGGNPTDASGNYEIKDLPISSAATQTFVFHKDGYTDQTKTLQQLGLIASAIIPNQTNSYEMQQVKLSSIALNTFDFVGELLFDGKPIEGAKLQIESPSSNFAKSSLSSAENFWAAGSDEQKIANVAVEAIPRQNEYIYSAKIIPTSINGRLYELDPRDTFSTFSPSDLIYDQSTMKYFYFKIFNLVSKEAKDYKIKFFDAKDGSNIDLSKENILRDDLMCVLPDNEQNNCVKSKDLWDNPNNLNNSIMLYSLSPEIVAHSFNLYFETANYIYTGGGLNPNGDGYAYLLRKSDKSGSLACRNIDGVDFCTYKAVEAEEFKPNRIAAYKRYAEIIKVMAAATNVVQLPDVFLIGKEYRAFARGDNNINAGKLDSQHIFSLSDMDVLMRGEFVVVHEFGHIVDFANGLNKKYFADFESAVKAGRGLKSDGSPIVNSSGQPIKSCNNIFQGYQCFSSYAITTNSYELWAEFFTWRVLHSDQVDKLINSAEMKKPENEHCRKTIMFLDWLMGSQFPRMKTFQARKAQSNIQNVADKFASGGLLQNITGQNAYAAESDSEFLRVMSEAGYYPASARRYDTVSKLSDLTFKAEDIAAGTWLQSNYTSLPPLEKTRIQLNIAFTRANNIVNVTTAAAQTTLNNLNTQITNILIRLGFRVTNTLVSGVVKDQDGPVEGFRISFGNKTAFTDNTGKYSMTKVPTGSFGFTSIDPNTNKSYATSPASTTMADNQQRKNMNLKIIRPSYQLKGKIYQGNNILAKGQLIIDGTRTVNLNAKGEFNFKLKEGQHKFIIRNSKGKTLNVSNPGAFGNLVRFNNIKDMTSLIWVK